MIKGMITYSMTLGNYVVENIRMLFNIVANAEESGFAADVSQGVEHEGREIGVGPVVESEVDVAVSRGHFPQAGGIEAPDPPRRHHGIGQHVPKVRDAPSKRTADPAPSVSLPDGWEECQGPFRPQSDGGTSHRRDTHRAVQLAVRPKARG